MSQCDGLSVSASAWSEYDNVVLGDSSSLARFPSSCPEPTSPSTSIQSTQCTTQSFSVQPLDPQIGDPMNHYVQTSPAFKESMTRSPSAYSSRCNRRYHRGNVSATMARLREDEGTLETKLYIVFNHEDEAARRCPLHLQSIFAMLSQVPCKSAAIDGSPKDRA